METQITIDDITAKIEVRLVESKNYKRYAQYLKEKNKSCRVYFFHDDENILQNLANRQSRPTVIYRKFLTAIAKVLILPENTKFRWSQYAGCSCPCSPGFICKEVKGVEVFVHLNSNAPKIDANKVDEANFRAQQVVVDPTLTMFIS